jgi:hypothetical protein
MRQSLYIHVTSCVHLAKIYFTLFCSEGHDRIQDVCNLGEFYMHNSYFLLTLGSNSCNLFILSSVRLEAYECLPHLISKDNQWLTSTILVWFGAKNYWEPYLQLHMYVLAEIVADINDLWS